MSYEMPGTADRTELADVYMSRLDSVSDWAFIGVYKNLI